MRLSGSARWKGAAIAALVVVWVGSVACSGGRGAAPEGVGEAARVGVDPVRAVHLLENHSAALIAWRRAGVRDRIVVHIDGHADFDWLPDATVARIAAASVDELPGLELHPYAMDGSTLGRFAIWNWIYPAARLGLVRELVWVVPDGTVKDGFDAGSFVVNVLLSKIQMVSVEEARTFRLEGSLLRGTLLGVPVTICRLSDLPQFEEPVLLDVDLDFFTTASAATQEVVESPWIAPERLVELLGRRGVRTDLATLSLSTIGGYLPPASRWLGPETARLLRSPGSAGPGVASAREHAEAERAAGRPDRAAAELEGLAKAHPDDAALWYALSRALAAAGRERESGEARATAVRLDPLQAHDELFEADARWLSRSYEDALARYRRYLASAQGSPFAAYALRREASCLMHLGRDDDAIAAFRKALELAPEHADTRLDLGVLLRERGDREAAIAEMERAARILPDRASYALALGTTYILSGRAEDGVRALQRAVERQPCLLTARQNLAAALLQLGRLDESAGQLRIAMSLAGAPTPQMRQLAARLERRGVPVVRVSAAP